MANTGHAGEMRKAILTAAEKVFDANGYAQSTMEAVAVEAGISKGSIYNYFESKQHLFKDVFTEAMASDQADVGELVKGSLPATERLERMLDDWFERLGHYKRIGRLVLEFWAAAARQEQQGELAATLSLMRSQWRGLIAPVIAQGLAAGEFGRQFDPQIAASLIMAIGNGITVQSILDPTLEVDEEFLAAMKRAIMAGLAAKGQGPQASQEEQNHDDRS